MPTLHAMLNALGSSVQVVRSSAQPTELSIEWVTADSRRIQQQGAGIFVALVGAHLDGHQFAQQAFEQQVAGVVIQRDHQADISIPATYQGNVWVVEDTYWAYARLCSLLAGDPGQHLQMIGVTGTNGKTTVTHLIQRILAMSGRTVGLLGTLGFRTDAADTAYEPSSHTTPMPDVLMPRLAAMRSEGIASVVMEVSSHALDQSRVAGCNFQVAVLTNLTQDHLDYHKTMDRYFQAKARLFEQLDRQASPARVAVINADDAYAQRFMAAVPGGVKTLTYSIHDAQAQVRAANVNFTIEGSRFDAITPEGTVPVHLKMVGEFSVYNALAALATGLSLEIPLATCVEALEATPSVRGRFELVSEKPYVIVDYAHTPDGLENVLKAARKVTPTTSQLWVVFGCGGDRDTTKRPKMGRLAESLADRLIITSDNPRTEDPQQIITDVLSGIERFSPATMQVEPDRRQAIRRVLDQASAGDVIVIAGKGHEDYQILKDKTIHFDDREEVQTYLAQRRSISQPTG